MKPYFTRTSRDSFAFAKVTWTHQVQIGFGVANTSACSAEHDYLQWAQVNNITVFWTINTTSNVNLLYESTGAHVDHREFVSTWWLKLALWEIYLQTVFWFRQAFTSGLIACDDLRQSSKVPIAGNLNRVVLNNNSKVLMSLTNVE